MADQFLKGNSIFFLPPGPPASQIYPQIPAGTLNQPLGGVATDVPVVAPRAGFNPFPGATNPFAEPAAPAFGMSDLKRGIATILGFPVDVISQGLGAIEVDVGPQPFGGRESIISGMESLGILPKTPGESVTPAFQLAGQTSPVNDEGPVPTPSEKAAAKAPLGALASRPFVDFPELSENFPDAPDLSKVQEALTLAAPQRPEGIDKTSAFLQGFASAGFDPGLPMGTNLLRAALGGLSSVSQANLIEGEQEAAFQEQLRTHQLETAKALSALEQQDFSNRFDLSKAKQDVKLSNLELQLKESRQLAPVPVAGGVMIPSVRGENIEYDFVKTKSEAGSAKAVFAAELARSDPKSIFEELKADPDVAEVIQEYIDQGGAEASIARSLFSEREASDIQISAFLGWLQKTRPEDFISAQNLAAQKATLKALK